MKNIEIIVPCHNESECINPLFCAIKDTFKTIKHYSFSVLFIDDGSKDTTLSEIKKLKTQHPENVNFVSFSRNFGKESAIYAGLSQSTGELVVLMDADLQHPPSLLPEMIEAIEEGYDCCGARRVSREGEPIIRSLFSKMFYAIINKVTMMNLVQGGSDFRIMTRRMVNAILQLQETERFTKGIMSWVGFDTKWIEYENVERYAGKSEWTFWGLVKYAVNGFISFATAPLRAVIWTGAIIVIIDIIYALYVLIITIASGAPRTGYASIIILLLFFGGAIISLLGIIGEYIARVYLELKKRPIFISKENSYSQRNERDQND